MLTNGPFLCVVTENALCLIQREPLASAGLEPGEEGAPGPGVRDDPFLAGGAVSELPGSIEVRREQMTPSVQPVHDRSVHGQLEHRGVAVLVFLYGVWEAFAKKRVAGANPWGDGATTLEWKLSSPPPFHQWEELPKVS